MYLRVVLKRVGKYFAIAFLAIAVAVFAAIPLARMERPGDLLEADNLQALAIDNVDLVTMNGNGLLTNRQLRIRRGMIEGIFTAGETAGDDYRLIDAEGAYLMPGLFDMHVHVFDRKYLALSLAYGVTSVRNMSGYPIHLRWKQELSEGQWLGSNLAIGSPVLNGREHSNPMAHKIAGDPGEAREMVREYREQGWDFVKVYTRLSRPVYEAIVDEAGKLDIPIAGHVPYEVVKSDYSLAAPMVTLEHTEEIFQGPLAYGYDDDAVEAVARQLKAMDANVTPTLLIFDHLTQICRDKQAFIDTLPLQYLNPLMRFIEARTSAARWLNADEKTTAAMEKRNLYFQSITRVLHEQGVNLVLGSDAGVIFAIPGISTHDEISLLQKAGLPNAAILEMATINAARVLRVDDRLGSIEAGKIADLVMTRSNPIEDPGALRSPSAVVKNGQWLGPNELQALKDSAENPSNAYYTFGRLLEFLVGG